MNKNSNNNNKKGMTSVSVPAEYSVRSWISIRRKEEKLMFVRGYFVLLT
jgi:hypothetical protein